MRIIERRRIVGEGYGIEVEKRFAERENGGGIARLVAGRNG